MIRAADVVRFDRLAGAGRNNPLRVVVATVDGDEHEAVLKPAGWRELTISSLVREYLASSIAGLVGAPVCEPFVANCSSALIGAIQDADIRSALATCSWPAFACAHAGRQWQNWSTGDVVTIGRRADALAILALDAFLDNPDRCARNPNLLVKGDQLRAIDHELSFSFSFPGLIVQPLPPWHLGGLSFLAEGDQRNVLLSPLSKVGGFDFGAIRAAWTGLADAELDVIVNSIPKEWGGAGAIATAALQRIKAVRDNIDACIVELQRVLT
jgi:hypothetical protein